MTVYKKIAKVVSILEKTGIEKGRKNQQQGYTFRGIDDIYNVLSGALVDCDLVILPRILKRDCQERTTAKGGIIFYTFVEAEFDIVSAEDGTSHTVRTFGEAMDSADKSTNKAMSAAYKYMALMTFCIPTEADNDTENHTHEVVYVDWAQELRASAKNGLGAMAKTWSRIPSHIKPTLEALKNECKIEAEKQNQGFKVPEQPAITPIKQPQVAPVVRSELEDF